jgi:hypothetical protein
MTTCPPCSLDCPFACPDPATAISADEVLEAQWGDCDAYGPFATRDSDFAA